MREHKWLTNLCANSRMIEMAVFGMDESIIRNNNKCFLVFMFDSYIFRCIAKGAPLFMTMGQPLSEMFQRLLPILWQIYYRVSDGVFVGNPRSNLLAGVIEHWQSSDKYHIVY